MWFSYFLEKYFVFRNIAYIFALNKESNENNCMQQNY